MRVGDEGVRAVVSQGAVSGNATLVPPKGYSNGTKGPFRFARSMPTSSVKDVDGTTTLRTVRDVSGAGVRRPRVADGYAGEPAIDAGVAARAAAVAVTSIAWLAALSLPYAESVEPQPDP